ncbi:DUF2635 domain-containing protein [Yersinia kristensenii]|uniref:Putative bacteriophage protein n=1 Tax=Yersinia kristensenii TaxID=28152 RepID=A0A0T9LN54_YERKR|nr:DUF2635 domain-containing protein [Yersinia kristensenii]MBW5810571.1 DUF2635 domain-containing protein [Yersinia kristensenii]MBW5823645.1 DUF2635 domain-containing protein [Yersinia kristensenii]MBW5827998.1 DUF2635 domain-containing protein [Yersinia kristensenii]MDA5487609.1 DUF2635 domain-containing protein [Yersinia kristensenii]OWF77037.1 DUF2635 domain-containing protein [Yersinia kristensenii]
MFVKPTAGRAVRDPVKGTFLPESGTEVPDNSFWHRRIQDGDVVQIPAKSVTSAFEVLTTESTKL